MLTMRLAGIDRGDRLSTKLLFRFISTVSRARFPDAARVAFYHRSFAGPELNAWTQRAMRGTSEWFVAERELMAAMVAQWNSCPFCVGAHSAVAVHGLEPATVRAALDDYSTAPIPDRLRAALRFPEKMTREPDELNH
jgi:AhpD family alkylhydroperoxidase